MDNLQMGLGYIGFSEEIVKLLLESEYFKLSTVIWEENRPIDSALLEDLRRNHVTFYTVSQKEQLISCMRQSDCVQFVMYKFKLILPQTVVNEYKVFNFHPGDLRTNRGATPVIWSILLGEPTSCMSLYRVSEKIDCGLLIEEATVHITDGDDSRSLQLKLEATIPGLLEKLYYHLKGAIAGVLIENGEYRRHVQEQDYTIDLNVDTREVISAKIRSQAIYKGAVLNIGDKKFFVTEMHPTV